MKFFFLNILKSLWNVECSTNEGSESQKKVLFLAGDQVDNSSSAGVLHKELPEYHTFRTKEQIQMNNNKKGVWGM